MFDLFCLTFSVAPCASVLNIGNAALLPRLQGRGRSCVAREGGRKE